MTDEFEIDENTPGSALREKLENALRENKSMVDQLQELKAKDVLSRPDLNLVKVDDLKGLKVDEIEAKATALQEERAAVQRALVQDALRKQGISEDELEARTDAFLSGKPDETEVPSEVAGIQNLSRLPGTPASRPVSELRGFDAILAGVSK